MRIRYFLCVFATLLSVVSFAQQWQWVNDLRSTGYANNRIMLRSNAGGDLFCVNYTNVIKRVKPSGTALFIDSLKGFTEIYDCDVSDDNSFFASGYATVSVAVNSTVFPCNGNFLLSLDGTGKVKWLQTVDNQNNRYHVAYQKQGNIFLAAGNGTVKKLNGTGGLLWQLSPTITVAQASTYGVKDIVCDSQGNVYVCIEFGGNFLSFNNQVYLNEYAYYSTFIFKVDGNGNVVQAEIIKDATTQSLFIDDQDALYLGCLTDESVIIREDTLKVLNSGCYLINFVAKLLPDNSCAWIRQFQTDCSVYDPPIFAYTVNKKGNVFATGSVVNHFYTEDTACTVLNGLLVLKLDTDGKLKWMQQAASSNTVNGAICMAAGNNNAVYCASWYRYDMTFGNINCANNDISESDFIALIDDGSITGIAKNNPETSFNISPNPCNGQFTIGKQSENSEISIYDCVGNKIPFVYDEANRSVLLTVVKPGLYIVQIGALSKKTVRKLVVQ